MAEHARFSVDTGVSVYFCDPRSPWQRGTNENTNGLLRQYFPKCTSVAVSQEHLDAVAAELNGRPRKTLGGMTPAEARRTDDRLSPHSPDAMSLRGRLEARADRSCASALRASPQQRSDPDANLQTIRVVHPPLELAPLS